VLGVAFSMVACSLFFASGGPALLAQALATPAPDSAPVLHAAESITRGITVAVAIGGPLLSASIVVEVAGALVARAATPAQIHLLLAPLRSLGLLAVTALVFPRMVEVLASVVAQRGP
jgi:type III secretory pathway component EscT